MNNVGGQAEYTTESGTSPTLKAAHSKHPMVIAEHKNEPVTVIDSIGGQHESVVETDVAPSLKAVHYKVPPVILDRSAGFCTEHSAKSRSIGFAMQGFGDYKESDVLSGCKARDYKDATDLIVTNRPGCRYIVRRLTPLECERLQGFPDGWTNIGDWTDAKGKKRKGDADAPRYKALGNSIALPPWCYVLTRLSLVCGGEQTMGSLFDGIGGFPLIWETINGKNTCLWASEIEDFPIAVTQKRFNGEEQT